MFTVASRKLRLDVALMCTEAGPSSVALLKAGFAATRAVRTPHKPDVWATESRSCISMVWSTKV